MPAGNLPERPTPPPTEVTPARIRERFEATRAAIEAFERDTRRDNTERAYRVGLRYFWSWAWLTVGVMEAEYPVPAELIEKFVADHLLGLDDDVDRSLVALGVKQRLGPLKLSTVRQRLWALGRAHEEALGDGFAEHVHTRVVRQLLKRAATQAQHRVSHPTALRREDLDRMLSALEASPTPRHLLMAAVMATAFAAGGLRRSELCALEMEDVRRAPADEPPGFRFELRIRESKTHSAGDEAIIQPVRGGAAVYLDRWLDLRRERGLDGGKLFRSVRPDGGISNKGMSPSWLYRAIKEAARLAGMDPANISPHSLRFGYVSSAHDQGIPLKDAMRMSRHASAAVHLAYAEAADKMTGAAGHLLPVPNARKTHR